MVDFEKGKPALTYYEVLSEGEYSSLVKLKPHTGRSHQLRVHMLHIGHVILGDRLYADGLALVISPRLALHAQEIVFSHPTTQTEMRFVSPHSFAEEPLIQQ